MAEKSKKAVRSLWRLPVTVLICAVVIALLSYAFTAENTYLLNSDDTSRAEAANRRAPDGTSADDARICSITVCTAGRDIVIACVRDDTVGQALSRVGIEIGEGDTLSAGIDEPIRDGMMLELTLYPAAVSPPASENASGLAQSLPDYSSAELSLLGNAISSAAEQMLASDGIADGYREELSALVSEPAASAAAGYYSSDAFRIAPQRTAADLSCGSYSPLNDPDAAHDYGAGITVFGESGNYTGETIWDFDDADGFITTATGETLSYSGIVDVSATAYTTENTRNRITATGTVARVGTIAVDPTVIPYGTKMYIVSRYGNWIYGYATAEDCGGGIKGHRVDLFYDTTYQCFQFGVRDARIYILD